MSTRTPRLPQLAPAPPLIPRKGSANPRPPAIMAVSPPSTATINTEPASALLPMITVPLQTQSPLSNNGVWPSSSRRTPASPTDCLAATPVITSQVQEEFNPKNIKYRRVLRRHVKRKHSSPSLPDKRSGNTAEALVGQQPHQQGSSNTLSSSIFGAASREGKSGYRTFDRTEGRVVEHEAQRMPTLEQLTRRFYSKLWKDDYEVENAEHRVMSLSQREQIRLAALSLRRKAQNSLNQALRRGVFDDQTALTRMQHALQTEFRETVGHLGFDTRELSLIRVHNAATDEVLHQKALYLAKLDVDRFQANVISDDVSATDILAMQLDAYRHRHVPHLIQRRPQQPSAGGLLAAITETRRRSSDRCSGSRAAIHSMVEKLQHALH